MGDDNFPCNLHRHNHTMGHGADSNINNNIYIDRIRYKDIHYHLNILCLPYNNLHPYNVVMGNRLDNLDIPCNDYIYNY